MAELLQYVKILASEARSRSGRPGKVSLNKEFLCYEKGAVSSLAV
jgi:hypothetical protein